MAEKEIIWSERAEQEIRTILDFYNQRNGSTRYSNKLLASIEKLISYLPKHNFLGRPSNNGITRVLAKKEFLIFYEVYREAIVIVSVWDNRQDESGRIDKG